MSGYFVAMELMMFGLLALCLWHAAKAGPVAVVRLLVGVLFGVLLEILTIWQINAYSYGRFALMVFDVPLAIGVGWGVIIYSAQLFSDRTTLPEWARAVLDALLALSIDLAMDVIAIRLGFWDWGTSPTFEFFGVPFGNFWGWFWVVFSYSGGTRLLLRWLKGRWQILAPVGGLLLGLIGVFVTNGIFVFVIPSSWNLPVVAGLVMISVGIVLALRPRVNVGEGDLVAVVVPLVLHSFFLFAGLVSGVILQPIALLVVSVLMLGLSVLLHMPWRGSWRSRAIS